MLQPIAVLREAGVNRWWLCVQNSRFSDTLLVEIGELRAEIQKTQTYYEEWRRDMRQYTYQEAKRLGLAMIEDPNEEQRKISALESDIEFLKGLL